MEKIMMMFPGVGSQQTGMGKDFYENRTSARDVMDEACDILSLNLLDYCFGAEHVNPQEHLEYIQCAIFAVNMACYAVYQSEIGFLDIAWANIAPYAQQGSSRMKTQFNLCLHVGG